MIRKGLHTKEIESLQHNLNQSISLVARAQDQMIWEINNRKRDSEIIKQDIQKNNDHRMTVMKDEFTEVHDELKHNISTLETEFLDVSQVLIFLVNKYYQWSNTYGRARSMWSPQYEREQKIMNLEC